MAHPRERRRPEEIGPGGVAATRTGRAVRRAGLHCGVLALIAVGLVVYATPSGAATYTAPTEIAADCSVDVSAALTSWVATVPDNSVISFPTNGCYRIDGTVELDGRNGLDFEGNGSTFTATTVGDGNRAHWRFVGGSQITVRNMTVVGSDAAGGTSSAFDASLQWKHGADMPGVSAATGSGM